MKRKSEKGREGESGMEREREREREGGRERGREEERAREGARWAGRERKVERERDRECGREGDRERERERENTRQSNTAATRRKYIFCRIQKTHEMYRIPQKILHLRLFGNSWLQRHVNTCNESTNSTHTLIISVSELIITKYLHISEFTTQKK